MSAQEKKLIIAGLDLLLKNLIAESDNGELSMEAMEIRLLIFKLERE